MTLTYKKQFNKKFKQPLDKSNSKADMTRLTGIPRSVINKIMERGEAAYYNDPKSVRPQIKNPTAWGYSRLYSFIMKAYDAVKKGKDKINQDIDLFDKIKNKLK